MKSKVSISKRHCPGEDYGISVSICKGRQKTHYPKCSQCGYRTDDVSNSPSLLEEQNKSTLTDEKQMKAGLTETARKVSASGTKQVKTGSKEKETSKASKTIKQKKTGSIMVKSEPSSATIYLNGESIGVTPAIIRQVLPGTYEIKIMMNGYETWKKNVNIVSSKEKSLSAILQGKNGSLIIESSPTNARIFVDNEYIGVTPAEISQIVPDTYEVKIKLDGYSIWKRKVDVKANKEKSLSAILQGKDGSIAIESEPTKGKIYIDGDYKSATPSTLSNLKPGEYTITIKLDKYKTWEKRVKVEPEKKTSITAVLLNEYGLLSLESEPSNAKILINGNSFGTTPVSSSNILHGTHLLEVIKDGYEVWRRKLKIEPGKEKSLTATLQLQTGSVSIESNPTKAMMYLDDKYVGTTPDCLVSITPGIHEVKLKLDGYDVWSESVNVEAGKENVLSASLQIISGSVMIESDPAKGTIYFDGNKIGETPDIIISSSLGTHLVEVVKEGYNTWSESVEIESGKEKSLSAILQIKTGSVSINSQPSPAMVIINGKEVGATPGTITNLIPGTYKIGVKKTDYEDWSENVEVVSDNEILLTAILQIVTGAVNINSEPSTAMIHIDGKNVGTTPKTISKLAPGKHLVEVGKDDYESWSKDVNIIPDKEIPLTATLQLLSGSISIESRPSDAKVSFDNKDIGTTPVNITDLTPGTHTVEVKTDGYEEWSQNAEIMPGKNINLTAELQVKTGSVSIKSEPSNARVLINEKNIGTTPIILADLKPGKYKVKIKKEDYEDLNDSIDIIPEKETDLMAELQIKPGSASIESKPSGAMVYLDDKEIRATPATLTDLTPGTHMVEVKTDGYKEWCKSIEIMPGKKVDLIAELQLKTGSVSIKSEPSEAMVLVNEKKFGSTPISLADLKPGKYKVKIKKEDYSDWNDNVDIVPEKETDLMAELQIKLGSVSIESKPSGTMVFLDDQEIGATPVTLTDLTPGTYIVKVKTDGHEEWNKSVEIMPGKKIDLTAELKVKTGSVGIKSEPSEAMVLLDEKNIGTTPIIIDDLIPGNRKLEIKVEGYEDWCERIDIIPEKKVELTAELKMKPGSFSMVSKPSGAMVFLDDTEIGATPVSITDLQPGTSKVEVKMDEYKYWSETVDIVNGKEISLTAVLQIQPGSVIVQSEPSDAIVILDNKESGKTPITISDLNPGKHSVAIKMEEYENWIENIDVKPNEEISFTAELRRFTGYIYIKSKPSKAKIYLDGEEVGTTPETLKAIEIGQHEIEVRTEGHTPWKKQINIIKGKNKKINAAFQINTGSVNITSKPSGAKTLIDGNEVGNTPVTISDLKPGFQTVEITMEGYEIWSEKVEILPDKETIIAAELQMKTGSLSINSEPPNAIAMIDGKEVDNTPITISDLKPGTYNVELKIDGYVNWKKSVDIIYDNETAINAELQIKTGTVCVKSVPSNAKILIEGNEVGNTPFTMVDLMPGTFTIEVVKEGHENWKESVDVISDKKISLTVDLQMKPGSVNIISEPADAIVILDGQEAGISPLTIDDLKPGTHNLKVILDGYEKWSKNIDINSNEEINITAELKKCTGSIGIKSNPPKAIIYLDSDEVGSTPTTLKSIAVGTHEVEIRIEGYKSWKKSIIIKKEKNKDIIAELQITTGSLNIMSEPTNAKTMLDGKEIGNTPVTITDLKQNTYNVEIIMDGFHIWKESVDVIPDNEISLSAMLKIKPGSVSVRSEPTDALVLLDDKEIGTTPISISDLKPGTHILELSRKGYKKWKEKINIKPNDENFFTAVLQKHTGTISIKSNPPNAILYIDNKEIDTTPCTLKSIDVGLHEFEVVYKGHKRWKKSINIIKEKNNNINAELQINTVSVSIESEPADAIAFIDGKDVGATPVTITDLIPGMHNVKIVKDGYLNWNKSVDITTGKEITLSAELQLKTGAVSIKSEPSNAKILINNKEIGTTPVTITDLKQGMHEVEVSMAGYENWYEKVDIKSDKENSFTAILQQITGSITIESNLLNAEIYLDGEDVGTTPANLSSVAIGPHEIKVSSEGYTSWNSSINIKKGLNKKIKAVLEDNTGSFNIGSKPSGATIIVDGKVAGITPLTIVDLKPGMHHVEVRLDGYGDWRESLEIIPGKEKKLSAVLQFNSGLLIIKSNPSGANILIDSNKFGVTPNTITDLCPGAHTVEIRKDRYEYWNESIDIIHNKEIYLTAILKLKTGSINLKSKPSNANVLLDGRTVGMTPVNIKDLTPETHYLEVRMDGYDDWRESIDIIPDKEISLLTSLKIKSGSISIMSIPSDAKVIIEGKEAGTTPITKTDLKPGTYNVEVLSGDYKDWKENVDIIPGKSIELTAVLQTKVGSVSVKSEPSDAIAFIDGKKAGTTPITLNDLKPGVHNIYVRMDGYDDWKESVNVIPEKEISLSATLQIKAGLINVKSEPSEAKTFIDGDEMGATPITLTGLKPGTHMLEVKKVGLEIWRKKVVVETDKEISIVALLQKSTGSLSIKSTPSKASIFIDGEEVGTTPATLSSIAIGSHEIEVKNEEYESWKKTIIIKKEKEKKLNVVLQLNVGSISIESYPEKAKIILDGNEVGQTPNRLTDIIVGTHDVEVLMDGYITWKRTLKTKAGKEVSLTVDLKKVIETIGIKTDSTTKTSKISKSIANGIRKPELKTGRREEKTIIQPRKSESTSSTKNTNYIPNELIKLRSTYNKILDTQINLLPKLSIRETNNSIFLCHSTINHCYQMKPIADGEVVIDHTTQLMWCKSGSNEYFNLRKAKKWIKMSNKKNYSGFNDWRLPTLEEASSLLEPEKKNGNFIDPIFDRNQWGTWTGDKCRTGKAWIVTFVNGTVGQSPVGSAATFVRPVRSLESAKK